jgi:hypothetical protein
MTAIPCQCDLVTAWALGQGDTRHEEATHRSGILHGDVKSDNFLVELIDGADHVTLIDFGLAQAFPVPASADQDHGEITISGTPEYMAPERIAGDPASPASDLYGAGVILYELLTGTTPLGGGTAMEIMFRQARDEVIPPSRRRPDRAIPPVIDRIVLRALDKRPTARFADAASFASALRAAAPPLRPLQPVVGGSMLRDLVGDPRARRSRHLARGSDCGSSQRSEEVEALRQEIGGALRRGDVAAIGDGYLRLGHALVGGGQLAGAIHELQEGIDILTAGGDPRESDAPPGVDQLAVALAALYETVGDRQLARHTATTTDHSPTWTFATGRDPPVEQGGAPDSRCARAARIAL